MKLIITILTVFVAIEHFYFLILEMFLWTTPKSIKAFGLKSKAFAEETKVLAANQGLYNGFLAAGLIFSIIIEDIAIAIFFLSCVLIAAIYGTYSTKKIRLFYVQGIPAMVTLILILFNLA